MSSVKWSYERKAIWIPKALEGEQILVHGVLKQGTCSSWIPMVTWRALYGNSAFGVNWNDMSEVKAIDWLSSCELFFPFHNPHLTWNS
jgi:hypothetical protein